MDKDLKQAQILQEISMCRDDERNSHSLMIQVVSVAGTILGVLLGASLFKDDIDVIKENLWILSIMSDLVFLTAYFFIIHLGIENVLRYYYLQDLEKQLCRYDDSSCEFINWMSTISPITTRNILHLKHIFSWIHYCAYMGTPSLAFGLCILISAYLFWQNKEKALARVGFDVLIAATLFGLLLLFVFSVHSRKIYEWSKRRAQEIKAQDIKTCTTNPEEQKENRRGVLYYIYPKIQDMQKLAMFILGAIFALYYQSVDWNSFFDNIRARLADFGIVFFAMEYCLYAARYQWNDIRGASEDEVANKTRKNNRGLPRMLGNRKKDVNLSTFILGIRLFLWLITLLYLINRRNCAYWSLLVVSGLMIVATVFYESARLNNNFNWILVFVGVGYPLRFWAGFLAIQPSFAAALKDSTLRLALVFALLELYFYGIMVATLPWTYFARNEKESQNKYKIYSKPYYYILEKHINALHGESKFSVKKIKEIFKAPWGKFGFISMIMCLIYGFVASNDVILKGFSVVSFLSVLGTFAFLYFQFNPNFSLSDWIKGKLSEIRAWLSNLYGKFVGKETGEWMKR